MRISAPTFRKKAFYVSLAVRALLAGALLYAVPVLAAETSRAAEEQAPQKLLEALDALSPSNPDPKDLATLFQLRGTVANEAVRHHIEDLVGVGFVIAKRQDLYVKRVRPTLTDPSRIEREGQRECPTCGGTGQNTIKCGRCGGTGYCPACTGAGKRRVNVDMQTLKGPVAAHQKPKEEFKEIPCATCKGTGTCSECNGEGTRKVGCPKCIGTGKVWDAAAANRLAMEAYDAIHAALKIMIFEASIPQSIATVAADGVPTLAPVFTFGDSRVAAIPARAAIGISGLSIFSFDKRPIPFSAVLAASNRDLVLLDLGQSSIVSPLELETDSSSLETGRRIYAYGTSRDTAMAARLDGKVLAAGPQHISSSVSSKMLADCAPLITDNGKLAGLFMYPMAEFNASGSISLMQNDGSALRLDNLVPADFIRVTVGDLNLQNNALTFAKRAIQSAKELLDLDNNALALRQTSVSEAVKRLDRAVAMLKTVRRWELFMMEATARELSQESEVRARNLEARLAEIARLEAERRAGQAALREVGETNVIDAIAAPQPEDEPSAGKPAKKAKNVDGTERQKSKTAKSENKAEDDEDDVFGLEKINWRKVISLCAVAIVAITVIFILIGVIQDKNRKRKLAEPPKIPDFIREMQEYERKHPGKKK
jgi:hypothetical protein